MAENASKVSPPGQPPASVPAVDGPAEQPTTTRAEVSAIQTSGTGPTTQDGDGDTMMISPTRPTNAGAPPTPEASPKASAAPEPAGPVPLDSPLRTTPIHPSLPAGKVPETALSNTPNTNPITLQPFTPAEMSKHGYEKLRAQVFAAAEKHGSSAPPANGGLSDREKDEIKRMRDETAVALKHKLDEREAKIRDIDREMEDKEKIREVERKVLRKKLGGGKDG